MSNTIPPLSGPALLLSEGGAHQHAPFSSLEAFRLSGRLGATAFGAKGWMTSDGQLVLAKDDVIGSVRRRRISSMLRDDLPESIPTLEELLELSEPQQGVALSLTDETGCAAAVAIARNHGAADRLWLRHPNLDVLGEWRGRFDDVHLVNTVRIPALKDSVERRAATLRSLGVDALEARHSEWSGGHVALLHRFGRYARATDANHAEVIRQLLRMGLDSIGGDHPDRLADAAAAFGAA